MMTKSKLWSKDFIFITLANLIMAISFYFMLPILPLFLNEVLRAESFQIGLVMGTYTLAAIIIRPFAGYALDALGRYKLYIITFSLFTVSFLGYPWATSVGFLIFVRFFHGLTWGGMSTAGSTIVVDIIPEERRGEGIGIYGLSMTIAMAIGPMCAIAIAGNNNYKRLFFSAIVISALGLLLAFMVKVPKTKPVHEKFSLKTLFEKKAIRVGLNLVFVMIPYGGIISFITLYGKKIGVQNSGLFFLIMAVGITISRITSGKVFDRYGPKKIIIIGLLILIFGFIWIGIVKNILSYHIAALILGFGFGILMPTYQAMANHNISTERRGAANSTFLTFLDIGIGSGMLIFGFLIDKIGFSATYLVSAGLELFSLFIFLLRTLPYYNKASGK